METPRNNSDAVNKPLRNWKCRRGHITTSENKPDVCRLCKKILTDLWLSLFVEIKLPPT